MKVCALIYAKSYKQGTICYIQETKTTTRNFILELELF